jgi:putative membrane protein
MYTGKVYKLKDMVMWTRFETLWFVLIITVWCSIYYFLDIAGFRIPWTPMALIGTAVAFVIGFQNNSVYGRLWEARKIWGGIVNTSRTFGMYVQDMVTSEHAKSGVSQDELSKEIKTLTYRHIAWLTALRHSMRNQKSWETEINHVTNKEWGLFPPETKSSMEEDLKP